MKTFAGLMLERKDLQDMYLSFPFEVIEWSYFHLANVGVLVPDDIVIFVDTDGRTKIIKNRFGKVN